MRRIPAFVAIALLIAGVLVAPRHLTSRVAVNPDFAHFESAHVHPAALTPSGDRLLVVNTPDGRLSVFDLTGAQPQRIAEIPVGLEPVAVAAASDSEAWVVNQLSDDVSIVNLNTLHVRATLRVGDEPSDVVFAGLPLRAYVSVSQEDRIRVYDPAQLASAPVDISVPGRMPRALARDASGAHVYAAVFHAGNRTSVLGFDEILPGNYPADPVYARSPALPNPKPRVGLIVQQQGTAWMDMYGNSWPVPYSVGDADVVEIATASNTVSRSFGDLATTNLGLAVSPSDGRVATTGTEALNLRRLEPRLRGHLVDTRLSLITAAGTAAAWNLNPHIDYETLPGTQAEHDSALGLPTGVAFSGDGERVYLTSMATDKLAVLDPDSPGAPLARVATVAGPTGVLADPARGRVYVVGRSRNQLQTLSAADLSTVAIAGIGFDPTPDEIVNGRKFFYGGFTSGHGDQACASCHLFGDLDNIAWDLGDPQGVYQPPPPNQTDPGLEGFDPEKGPMITQSLRGLPGTGLLHWRGDRADLNAFNGAFVSLMGREQALPDSEMAAFNEFVLPLVYPPNPNQHLDRTWPNPASSPSAHRGRQFFMNTPTDGGVLRCVECHSLPTGTNGQVINDGALQIDLDVKVPQLRNLYKKTGFRDSAGVVNKRGFGFIHDGSFDNLFTFLHFPGFVFAGDQQRRDVEAFLLAFDTGMAPAVGYQLTFDGANNSNPVAMARLDTLRGQAHASNADLIAKGRIDGQPRGWFYLGADQWQPDEYWAPPITSAQLRALGGPGSEVTVTGVTEGAGTRLGIDRDRDTYYDHDERVAGSDPGNPLSTPENVGVRPEASRGFALRSVHPNPFRSATEVVFTLPRAGRVGLVVHDLLGREVRTVARGVWLEPGLRSFRWDGRAADGSVAPAGVYFVALSTGDRTITRPVVRLR